MATKTHVDSRVQERRLRPIYDWLDSGNNKKALQEAEKILKKHPNFLCAKVLKALALQRLGRESECEELLENVCSEVPTDEATLQAITICYRAIHKPSKICDVYLAASKKEPTNEELLTHLFMSYVRIGDYRKQHQHAMSLYKLRPKNPYYFWAVMSVVMQAKEDGNIGKTVALKLAEKMVSKFVEEKKIEAEQEVQLYLMILELQGKYEEALKVIEGSLGEKLKSLVTTAEKRIELLIKLERWKEANAILKHQWKKNPDSWVDCKNYLKTMLKLYSNYLVGSNELTNENEGNNIDSSVRKSGFSEEKKEMGSKADYSPEMAKTFIDEIINGVEKSNKRLRGPYLGKLELYRVLENESMDAKGVLGSVTDLLLEYFDRFGDKPMCFIDLKPYLSLLNTESVSEFLEHLNDKVGLAAGESPSTVCILQKHITSLQLKSLLGFYTQLSIEERLKMCNLFINYYESSKTLVSPDKLPTDFACNDPYIILLSHLLFSIYQETNNRIHIIRAIYHLENGLSASPSNFHFKLLLVKFYLLLGAGQQAFHFYDHLETKYIQLDSIGYLIGTSGFGLGSFWAAVSLYDNTLKFFFSNTNDSADHLTYAYKFGSFMKIQEFIQFRDRLNDSLYYTYCTIEKMLYDLLWSLDYTQSESIIKSMEIKPGIQKVDWDKMRDNRDLNVIVSFEPLGRQLKEKTIEMSFENLKYFAKLRHAIKNCLCAVYDFIAEVRKEQNSDRIENGDIESGKIVLIRLVSELKLLYDKIKSQDLFSNLQDVINSPPPCRLQSFIELPICQIISDLVDILLSIDVHKEEESLPVDSVIQAIQSATFSCVSKINPETIQTREMLEEIVGMGEMFSITSILCGSLKSYLKKCGKNLKKGRRKKEDEGIQSLEFYKSILQCLSDCITELYQALNKVSELNSMKVFTDEVQALSISESDSDLSNIEKKLHKSYVTSVDEIQLFLNERQFYINSLRS